LLFLTQKIPELDLIAKLGYAAVPALPSVTRTTFKENKLSSAMIQL
jgi:hypothetical protein